MNINEQKSLTHHNDCMEVTKSYPDNHFDLAIVDPPYSINAPKMSMGSNPNRKQKGQYPGVSTATRLKDEGYNTAWDKNIPHAEYWAELFRVSKNQIIWGANYFPLPPTRCMICWNKKQSWEKFSQFEFAWTSFNRTSRIFNHSNRGGNNIEKKIHPTQKPVELYTFCLENFVESGSRILDTHLGSGSSRIAAHKWQCDFVGCEIDKRYFDAQEARFEKYLHNLIENKN